ncbi:MAG: hypothetical protein OXK80_01540 [Bdellovibrionales bacterium]|nr:hypothetical protein [Bdellovibrionales bacterium]
MKKIIFVFKILLLSISLSSLTGCVGLAFSRLTEPHTAQTLGKGNNEVVFSAVVNDFGDLQKGVNGVTFPSLQYTRGLSDNFDLGVFVEVQSLRIPLIGLEGKYQWTRKDKQTVSLIFGAGINKGYNAYAGKEYNEVYGDLETFKQVASEFLPGYSGYVGPVYSFKPNKKYELALNARVNYSYFQVVPLSYLRKETADIVIALGTGVIPPLVSAMTEGVDYSDRSISKQSFAFFYGSASMSHTWWMVPSFGATISFGLMYPLFAWPKVEKDKPDSDFRNYLAKSGLNFHFNF